MNITEIMKNMTLREKIGQTAVFRHHIIERIPNYDNYFSENPVGFTWLMQHPREIYIKLEDEIGNTEFKGTKEDFFADYINKINKNVKIPVMPVCDASQGISRYMFDGHGTLPTAAGIGATKDPELAYEYGKALGDDLHSVGYRWLWSPVVDNAGVFKGSRSFGCDPSVTKELVKAFIKGVQDAGVATGTKHFPGVDPYEYRDSHFCTSSYSQSLEYWFETQGAEFQSAIDAGTDSIMVGHKTFRAVDDERINGVLKPATISYKIVTELLKERMGFKGVVVSDDISMKALTAVYPYKQLYIELLNAGIDAILGPMDLDYIDIVEQAVLDGRIKEERIDDACFRILTMKEKYGVLEKQIAKAPAEDVKAAIRQRIAALNERTAQKGLTLTANHLNFIPVSKEKIKKVKAYYIGYSAQLWDDLHLMKEEFERHGAECEIQDGYTVKDNDTVENYDLIVYVTYIGMHAPRGGSFFFGEKCTMMLDVMTRAKEKSVAVSFGDPNIYFNYFTAAPTYVNCYSINKESIEGFVKGLYGEIEFTSFTPFPLNPITRNNEVF